MGSQPDNRAPDPRAYAPAVARNREPILAVLRRVLPETGLVLELASGSGEHAAFFAASLPGLLWQPSDVEDGALASIAAWRENAKLANLLAPLRLDVASGDWPLAGAAAIVAINLVHISPWSTTEALMTGARRVLPQTGTLYLYGAYRVDGQHTAESNRAFDDWLKAQNPEFGVRDLEAVIAAAESRGLRHVETVPMPANNLSLVFRRAEAPAV
jgi:Protein of unknown function (DUF938)